MFEETNDWDESEDDGFYGIEDDDFYVDDDDSETVPCPDCGEDVYEDAERCPACGNYIVHTRPHIWANRPLWWIVLGACGIAAVIVMFLF